MKPVDAAEAQQAVAGLDAAMMNDGLPPREAVVIKAALQLYLMGDEAGARAVLAGVFMNGTVDDIIAKFSDNTAVEDAA